MIHSQIYLWTYVDDPRNYRGFHLTADDAGCDVLLRRIKAMQVCGSTSRLQFELTSAGPRELAVVGYDGRARKFDRWIVNYSPTEPADAWAFTVDERTATLSLGRAQLTPLLRGIEDIRRGRGDYSLGDETHSLWLWWRVA